MKGFTRTFLKTFQNLRLRSNASKLTQITSKIISKISYSKKVLGKVKFRLLGDFSILLMAHYVCEPQFNDAICDLI